jgi:hypothetical protein
MTTTELSDNEKALLAREVAADKSTNPTGYGYDQRGRRAAFIAGWNAAMEYAEKQRQEQQREQTREIYADGPT